ncbi:MAG TPA: peptidylprolyl isomerase [Draconibacterium sp.]|nr:peptidylprolyl isomerase [Draconibacterium sp.]
MTRLIITFLLLLGVVYGTQAQDKIIDQVVAVVGGNIILKSDIENMNLSRQAEGYTTEGDAKCEILEDFLVNKLLIAEAELDTLITVTPSQINQQMDYQMQNYIQQIGSERAVEEYFNMPIATIKANLQQSLRENLLSQQMRSKIVENVTVTPSEVRYNYRNLSNDEIPTIPEQYEYAQITIQPKIDLEEENRVKAILRDIKKQIEEGSMRFNSAVVRYSEDVASVRDGGELPYMGRAQLDPAYYTAASNLKGDKISNVVESAFGFHIIQLIDKEDSKVKTRHILIKPKISVEEKEVAYNRIDSLANLIRRDEITFEQAAQMFSYDKNTRNNGGIAINSYTMSSKFSIEEIDPDVSKVITKLNLNEVSAPFESINPENQKQVYKIIKLIDKAPAHKANLQEDYQILAEMYLAKKKEEALMDWIAERQSQTYIRIDRTYANCNFNFDNWIK